jgi:DNA helicase II / ATP-dependent DNA helicase PcrA
MSSPSTADPSRIARALPEDMSRMPPQKLLQGLNPEQLAAVTLPAQPALILAGAGSGKTRVLTTRVAWLLHTGQVSPGGILAVTFTNKAAKEMLTRLSAMLPIPVRGMWIGTFHGLCNRFLRAHWKLAGLPQSFQILDAQDTVSAVKRVIKALNIDDERFVPKQVSWFIASSKEDGLRPADIEQRDAQTRTLATIYQAYQDQCEREGAHLRIDARPRSRAFALPHAVPSRAGGRVSGHQPPAIPVAENVCPAAGPAPTGCVCGG